MQDITEKTKTDDQRSSDAIRREIAAKKEDLADTVDQLGEVIKEKADWRSYVRDYPLAALGVAAGVGLIASAIFKSRRDPIERLVNSVSQRIGVQPQQSAIKLTLMGFAGKAAMNWLQSQSSSAKATQDVSDNREPRRRYSPPLGQRTYGERNVNTIAH